ncbi:hypothetical protein PL9214670053 [Planktothrix tepida PCC 9214]|uniref:Uncharacterized protein n=1 Tax=Planktothrix tepida PCC 9214 TaxID=671072 RepID=A0A1J1LS46_9CYAN|nr:hypothetical protein PL9214670053 [Planktothrix tepida PCC 9214]
MCLSMGCNMKVELSLGNFCNQSSLYPTGDVKSNALEIGNFSVWASSDNPPAKTLPRL